MDRYGEIVELIGSSSSSDSGSNSGSDSGCDSDSNNNSNTHVLSVYELEREAKIKRNKAVLAGLGLERLPVHEEGAEGEVSSDEFQLADEHDDDDDDDVDTDDSDVEGIGDDEGVRGAIFAIDSDDSSVDNPTPQKKPKLEKKTKTKKETSKTKSKVKVKSKSKSKTGWSDPGPRITGKSAKRQFPSNYVPLTTHSHWTACKTCYGCLAFACGICVNCDLNKREGKVKRKCLRRMCVNPKVGGRGSGCGCGLLKLLTKHSFLHFKTHTETRHKLHTRDGRDLRPDGGRSDPHN